MVGDRLILQCVCCRAQKSILVFELLVPHPVCSVCSLATDVCPGCAGAGETVRGKGKPRRHQRCQGTGRVPGGDRLPGTGSKAGT